MNVPKIPTSIIVSAEIRFGLSKGVSKKLQIQTEKVLDVLDILPLEEPVDEHYGKISAFLNQAGKLIVGNDLLIAAHALALDLTLVSANIHDFPGFPTSVWKTGWRNERFLLRIAYRKCEY